MSATAGPMTRDRLAAFARAARSRRRSVPGRVVVCEVEHLRSFGRLPKDIAGRLGMSQSAVERALYRAGRNDLAGRSFRR